MGEATPNKNEGRGGRGGSDMPFRYEHGFTAKPRARVRVMGRVLRGDAEDTRG